MLNKYLMWYFYSSNSSGRMAELADALALGASGFKPIRVRLSFRPPEKATVLGLITSVVPKIKSKFVAVIVALKTKCCKVERVCREGCSSRALVRLRNYPPNSYIPTTAYFLAIPTIFF